jgi:hypothetical protein
MHALRITLDCGAAGVCAASGWRCGDCMGYAAG